MRDRLTINAVTSLINLSKKEQSKKFLARQGIRMEVTHRKPMTNLINFDPEYLRFLTNHLPRSKLY